jgi:hypothetical protein
MIRTISTLLLAGACCVGCEDRSASTTPKTDQAGANETANARFNSKDFVGRWSLQKTNWSTQVTNRSAILLADLELREDSYCQWKMTSIKGGATRQYHEEGTWRIVGETFRTTITNSTLEKIQQPEEEANKILSSTADEFSYETKNNVWTYKRKK